MVVVTLHVCSGDDAPFVKFTCGFTMMFGNRGVEVLLCGGSQILQDEAVPG